MPEWQVRPRDETRDLIEKTTCAPEWIVCGNFSAFKEFTTDRADTIIWLDYPFWLCFWQALKRSVKNIRKQQKCCNGNQESWGRLFSKNSIMWWMVKTFWRRNKRYEKMMQDPAYKDKVFVRLKSHKETEKWLEKL